MDRSNELDQKSFRMKTAKASVAAIATAPTLTPLPGTPSSPMFACHTLFRTRRLIYFYKLFKKTFDQCMVVKEKDILCSC